MNTTSAIFPLVLLITHAVSLSAQAQVDTLAPVKGFVPSLTLTESSTDSVKSTTIPTGPGTPAMVMRELVPADKSSVTIVANITGIDLASINPDTSFEVSIGPMTVAGFLGLDSTYTEANQATKRSIFIPAKTDFETGKAIGSNGTKISWAATRLTITIVRALGDDIDPGLIAAMGLAGQVEPGITGTVRDTVPVSVSFGNLVSEPRSCFIKGTTLMREQKFGSESQGNFEAFFLNTVSLTGAFDTAVPTVSITSPVNNSSPGAAFTLVGKAGDTNGIDSVEYSTDPLAPLPWEPLVEELTDLPPALAENTLGEFLWGTTNKQWTLSLVGQPFGTNKIWVRSVDSSGNRSLPATIALINPVPALLTGRWDGLEIPTQDGRSGYLTFTCDVKGALTGKLSLDGSAAPLSFTGLWSGGDISASIKRPIGLPLLLTGTVNSTSPANAAAALITFALKAPAAVTGAPNVDFGAGTAFRSPFSSTNKLPKTPVASPALGRFNLAIAQGDGTASPSGSGYFSMVVGDTGVVTIAGKLADGSPLTMGAVLGASGQVPIFIPLYGNKGSFSVLEQIDMTLGTLLAGTSTWQRPANFTDKQFPAGHMVNLDTTGGRYTAPALMTRVLSLLAASPNASAQWMGGAAPAAQTQILEVTKTNTVLPVGGNAKFTAVIASATGIISGNLPLPGTAVVAPYSSMIVETQAEGHYIAPSLPGTLPKRFGKFSLAGNIPTLAGGDDFDDNTKDLSKWRAMDQVLGGSVLTEVNQRLEYTVKTAGAEAESIRPWTRNFGSLDDSFEAILDVHNAVTPPVAGSPDFQPCASIGLNVHNTADARESLYVELYRGRDGYYFLSAVSQGDDETGSDATAAHLSVDGSVRLHYDSATKVITTSYDADGATGGYNWTVLGSFGINGSGGTTANTTWNLAGNPVLGIGIEAYTEKMIVPSGQVHADNFQVNTD